MILSPLKKRFSTPKKPGIPPLIYTMDLTGMQGENAPQPRRKTGLVWAIFPPTPAPPRVQVSSPASHGQFPISHSTATHFQHRISPPSACRAGGEGLQEGTQQVFVQLHGIQLAQEHRDGGLFLNCFENPVFQGEGNLRLIDDGTPAKPLPKAGRCGFPPPGTEPGSPQSSCGSAPPRTLRHLPRVRR